MTDEIIKELWRIKDDMRIFLPEVPVHVIQRGIDRAACFFSDEDRQVYLDTPRFSSIEIAGK